MKQLQSYLVLLCNSDIYMIKGIQNEGDMDSRQPVFYNSDRYVVFSLVPRDIHGIS